MTLMDTLLYLKPDDILRLEKKDDTYELTFIKDGQTATITGTLLELVRQINTVIGRRALNNKEIILTAKSIVEGYFEISLDNEMASRKLELVRYRMIAHSIILDDYKYRIPLREIGWMIGQKDHATVLHAHKTLYNDMRKDKQLRTIYNEIKTLFRDAVNYSI